MTSRVSPTDRAACAGPATVLLADDNGALREGLARWLTAHTDWTVREAADGREAVAGLDDAVDAAVIDREMPELTGDEVVDRLPETSFSGAVVVLSAAPPDERLDEESVDEYVLKPVGCESLAALLSPYLR